MAFEEFPRGGVGSARLVESVETDRGFTILELLVSVAVLILLIALVTQLLNGASASIIRSGKHIDADTEARLILSRMAGDLTRALKRTDVDYSAFKQPTGALGSQYDNAPVAANLQPGNDRLAFYSETAGYFSGAVQPSGSQKSTLSLVAYRMGDGTGFPGLLRFGTGLGWESDSGGSWGSMVYLPMTLLGRWPNLFSTSNPDYKVVGSQVFRMEYSYLLKANASQPARLSITPWDTSLAHTSINGFQDVSAIVVTLGVLDSTSQVVVKDTTKLTALFPDARDGEDVAATWNAIVEAPTFAASADIARAAAAAVRIYQRYIYLQTSRLP